MTNKEQIEWAKEVPFLAAMPKKNPFLVPEGYFETAAAKSKTEAVISNHSNVDGGFTVPEGYFTGLTANIMSEISMQGLKEENAGFALPEGYFTKLSSEIMAKTAKPPKKEVKILKLWSSDFMKYATAACVVLVFATTFYINQQNTPVIDTSSTAELYNNEQLLYDIDEEVIVEHVEKELAKTVAAKNTNQVEEYLLENYTAADLAQEL